MKKIELSNNGKADDKEEFYFVACFFIFLRVMTVAYESFNEILPFPKNITLLNCRLKFIVLTFFSLSRKENANGESLSMLDKFNSFYFTLALSVAYDRLHKMENWKGHSSVSSVQYKVYVDLICRI